MVRALILAMFCLAVVSGPAPGVSIAASEDRRIEDVRAAGAAGDERRYGTREEAVAMVERVQEMFLTKGPGGTFAAINDPETPQFHDRDLYPFVYDMHGVSVAHGARPVLIGKDLSALKDQDGKYLIREMIEIARGPGAGWIDYKWPHPTTNRIEDKSSYIERMGLYLVGVGVYRD